MLGSESARGECPGRGGVPVWEWECVRVRVVPCVVCLCCGCACVCGCGFFYSCQRLLPCFVVLCRVGACTRLSEFVCVLRCLYVYLYCVMIYAALAYASY